MTQELDPIQRAALAIAHHPKLFLCLLGSGVSGPAGIPTGWKITLDLVRSVAAAKNETIEPGAEEEWCKRVLGYAPQYDKLMQLVAPDALDRIARLRPYFVERDEVEKTERLKPPTQAHRSLAALIKSGHIRVVLTTNFDSLTEEALRAVGVARLNVLTSEEDITTQLPFHTRENFLVKLHGDWEGGAIRNIAAELGAYHEAWERLLDRVLDEHGLIICGWSAEWDVALRNALKRRTAQHSCVWVDPGELGPAAAELLAHLRATRVRCTADEFFEKLELTVKAIDSDRIPENLDAKVVVARAKRLISEKREVELDDLVDEAARELADWIENGQWSPAPDQDQGDGAGASSGTWARSLLDQIATRARALIWLTVTIARYTDGTERIRRALSFVVRSTEYRLRKGGGEADLDDFWYWQVSHLVAYAFGVSCVAREQWRRALEPLRATGIPERVWRLPACSKTLLGEALGRFRHHAEPYSRRMREDLLEPLGRWIPDVDEQRRAFDRFEYLLFAISIHPERQSVTEPWIPGSALFAASLESPGAVKARQEQWRRFWIDVARRRTEASESELLLATFGRFSEKDVLDHIEQIDSTLRSLRARSR